jgi:hypothetical protein
MWMFWAFILSFVVDIYKIAFAFFCLDLLFFAWTLFGLLFEKLRNFFSNLLVTLLNVLGLLQGGSKNGRKTTIAPI